MLTSAMFGTGCFVIALAIVNYVRDEINYAEERRSIRKLNQKFNHDNMYSNQWSRKNE